MNTPEQEKDIKYSQGFLEEWSKTQPAQVQDAVRLVVAGYDQLRKQVGQQDDQIAEQAKLLAEQRSLTNAALQLSRAKEELDDINDSRDETRLKGDPEFKFGWNLVGGIRFGKPVAVRDLNGQDFLKVMIAPLVKDYQVDFDVFPLAIKRASDGSLQKIVVDFTKGLGYE